MFSNKVVVSLSCILEINLAVRKSATLGLSFTTKANFFFKENNCRKNTAVVKKISEKISYK